MKRKPCFRISLIMLFCLAMSLLIGSTFSINAQEDNSTSRNQNLGQKDLPNENKVCQTCESSAIQNQSQSVPRSSSETPVQGTGGGKEATTY